MSYKKTFIFFIATICTQAIRTSETPYLEVTGKYRWKPATRFQHHSSTKAISWADDIEGTIADPNAIAQKKQEQAEQRKLQELKNALRRLIVEPKHRGASPVNTDLGLEDPTQTNRQMLALTIEKE